MAKITKKIISKIFDDYKNCHFISEALDNNKVNPVDFHIFLEENEESQLEFERIEKYINLYLEDKVAKISYANDKPSHTILLEMIRNNNKKKYINKEEKTKDDLSDMTFEELELKLQEIESKLDK